MQFARPQFAVLAAALIAATATPLSAAPVSFSDAQRRAVERSRLLNAHDASVASSLESAQAAGRLPDPVLRLGLENVPAEGADRFSLSRDSMTMRRVGVMQEVTASDKRSLKRERFEREADKTRAEKEAATAAIQRDTALAWLDRYYYEEMRRAVAEFVRASDSEVESADSAFRGGRGSQVDVFNTRAAVALARDRQADIERRARGAGIDLARWTGIENPEPVAQLPDMAGVRLADGRLEDHLSTHPEIVAVDRQADVASAEARLARAGRTPDWTWEAAYQVRGSAYSNMFSIGVSMPLPWDAANRQDRDAAAKLATVEELHARRDEMLRAHVAEVRSMLEEWRVGRERQARYRDEILPLTRDRTTASLAAYAGNKATLAEVLAARRGELEVRLQSLQLDQEVARLWARLNFLLPDASHLVHAAAGGTTR